MDKLSKCIWLATVILKSGNQGVTLREINQQWQYAFDADPIPRKTFDNYKHYIEELFDINIDCIKSRNAYVVNDADNLYSNELKMWLLNSFSMSTLIASDIHLRKRIQFEKVPSGIEFLEPLVRAIKDNKCIDLCYQTFYWEEPCCRIIQPYALKLFKQRWYLVGCNDSDQIRLFSLDRIKSVKSTETTFKLPVDFTLESYYANHFGIVHHDGIAETLRLKVESEQAKYLKRLPWHESQRVVEEEAGFLVFEWELHLTFDLRQQILSLGRNVEVLEPLWFRNQVKEEIEQMAKLYQV